MMHTPVPGIVFSDLGLEVCPPGARGPEWLDAPLTGEGDRDAFAFCAQLLEAGHGDIDPGGHYVLVWEEIFDVLEATPVPESFALPSVARSIRPILSSVGSLTDPDLRIRIDGWLDGDAPIGKFRSRTGAILEFPDRTVLATREVLRLLEQIRRINVRDDQDRALDSNRRRWARVRSAAIAAHAQLDSFMRDTIVIEPEQLQLMLARQETAGAPVIEITPTFENAPERWVEIFDRTNVTGTYRVPVGNEYYEIVIDPDVRAVLDEIKRLPGRRVAGDRAQRLVDNPIAFFGPDLAHVLDEEHIEDELAGIRATASRLTAVVSRDSDDAIESVGVVLEKTRADAATGVLHPFADTEALGRFIARFRSLLERGSVITTWRGADIEIDGDTPVQIDILQAALDEWRGVPHPGDEAARGSFELVDAASVLDVGRYSDRVEAIGIETPWAIVNIPRSSTEDGWFGAPDEPIRLALTDADGAMTGDEVSLTPDGIREFVRRMDEAVADGSSHVRVPGAAESIPIDAALAIIDALPPSVVDHVRRADDRPDPDPDRTSAGREKNAPRLSLLIASNVDSTDYLEARGDALRLPEGHSAQLPSALRSSFQLKDHQLEGLAWMQHLWSIGAEQCRGGLLADDMGLGKTLQSLAFIARLLEDEPDIEPALIVAPVSLLDNWAQEAERFFEPGAFQVKTLYGPSLRSSLIPRDHLPQELKDARVDRLLLAGWRDGANIVLTTYETLRDLQFSFAELEWSVVVCDEAQRIKNPNTLATRAAKKLKSRFRIAATGTPVENSLQDLWSIFDFIQPGLLAPLSEFTKRFRRPIESRSGDEDARIRELDAIIRPQYLRRLKEDVAKDLPTKSEDQQARELDMSPAQQAQYRAIIDQHRMTAGGGSTALQTIQQLKRMCTDPRSPDEIANAVEPIDAYRRRSPKFDWLITTLEQIETRQEKALIFVEFLDIQRQLQFYIEQAFGFAPDIINGSTSTNPRAEHSRQRRLDRFTESDGFNVMILSPIAAGVGLNIQAANHVIHYMRHWNPAKEDQATDRAYRIGQSRPVTVYTPIVRGNGFVSFDERLDALLAEKRRLATNMYNGAANDGPSAAEWNEILEGAVHA